MQQWRNHARQSSRQQKPESLLQGNKQNYFDAEGNLNPDYVGEKAQEIAQKLQDMASSQLRRFYDEAKAIERAIELAGDEKSQESAFRKYRPMLSMLKAKAAYGNKRSGTVVPDSFVKFLADQEVSINDREDFRAFMRHFEAVVAYHKFFAKK